MVLQEQKPSVFARGAVSGGDGYCFWLIVDGLIRILKRERKRRETEKEMEGERGRDWRETGGERKKIGEEEGKACHKVGKSKSGRKQ